MVNVKQAYYLAEWEKRADILEDLQKYYTHTNFRLAYEIYSFCTEISEYNRGVMTKDVACSIFGLVMNFFPYSDSETDHEKITQLLDECSRVGFNIACDAAIYLQDYTVVMYGLTILKYTYKKAREKKNESGLEAVDQSYKKLAEQLSGSEFNNYNELIGFFKDDLKTNSLEFPILSEKLMNIIYSKSNKHSNAIS